MDQSAIPYPTHPYYGKYRKWYGWHTGRERPLTRRPENVMGDELPAKAAVTCHARYHDDPIVLVHARALLTSTPEGATAYIDADLRDPDTILQQAAGPWTSPSQSRSC
jgi:hypothetical protein